MKTAQMIFEDSWGQVKVQFNSIKLSTCLRFFLFLSTFGKVVLLRCVVMCKKVKRTTRMKCEEVS